MGIVPRPVLCPRARPRAASITSITSSITGCNRGGAGEGGGAHLLSHSQGWCTSRPPGALGWLWARSSESLERGAHGRGQGAGGAQPALHLQPQGQAIQGLRAATGPGWGGWGGGRAGLRSGVRGASFWCGPRSCPGPRAGAALSLPAARQLSLVRGHSSRQPARLPSSAHPAAQPQCHPPAGGQGAAAGPPGSARPGGSLVPAARPVSSLSLGLGVLTGGQGYLGAFAL